MSDRKENTTSLRKFRKVSNSKSLGKFSLIFISIIFILLSGLIIFRLYELHIVKAPDLRAEAARQQQTVRKINTKRGAILDRNGYPMVTSSHVYRIGMTPSSVSSTNTEISQEDIAEKVISSLNLDSEKADKLRSLITVADDSNFIKNVVMAADRERIAYMQLAAGVEESEAEGLKDWLKANSVSGFRFDAEERRVYSNPDMCSLVLGMTRSEADGIVGTSGLEASYEDVLSGSSSYIFHKRNNFLTKGVIPFSNSIKQAGSASQTLYSTIDNQIQKILHEELLSIAAVTGSINGVSGIVMDPYSGDILAMDQIPAYNASNPSALPLGFKVDDWNDLAEELRIKYRNEHMWTNINVSSSYEPGSTFKTVTLAVALEENVANEQTIFNDSPVTVQGATMYCITGAGHGDESLREGFYRSCNPVFVRLAERIGQDTYYDYIEKLGFKNLSGIDLSGEARGLFHEHPMPIDFANLSFGESSTVTPIQLARFYCSIANGGYLVKPRLVRAYKSNADDVYHDLPLAESEQVFSEDTCNRVLSLLSDVVYEGNNHTFGSEGFTLGGKTGTSTDERDGDKLTYSFAGVAPIEDPRIVTLVIIRKPELEKSSIFASRAHNRIAARVLNYMGLEQNYSASDLNKLHYSIEMPDLSGLTVAEAAYKLSDLGLFPQVPVDQFFLDQPLGSCLPEEGSLLGKGSTVWLYPESELEVEWVAVPDFTAKNYHECVWLASESGLVIQPIGEIEDKCVAQSIKPYTDDVDTDEDSAAAPQSSEQNEHNHKLTRVKKGTVIKLSFSESVELTEEPVQQPVYIPPVEADPEEENADEENAPIEVPEEPAVEDND